MDLNDKSPWELTKMELDGIITPLQRSNELRRRRVSIPVKSLEIPAEIIELASLRNTARTNKDYVLADSIRIKIENLGWKIEDTDNKYSITPKRD